MQEPWFYCPDLRCGELALDAAEARHAAQSRRLCAGDTLTVFDGAGHVAEATLVPESDTKTPKSGARGHRGKRRPTATIAVAATVDVPPLDRKLALIVPACKGPRLDWLVEKCTELGVTRLILAEFERSVVHPGSSHIEKLRRTAIAACKQCRRAWLPQIEVGDRWDVVATPAPGRSMLVAHTDAAATPLAAWLAARTPDSPELLVIVGPEGGLSDGELDTLRSRGAHMVGLGPHVLRVETAAVAIAACWAAQGLR